MRLGFHYIFENIFGIAVNEILEETWWVSFFESYQHCKWYYISPTLDIKPSLLLNLSQNGRIWWIWMLYCISRSIACGGLVRDSHAHLIQSFYNKLGPCNSTG